MSAKANKELVLRLIDEVWNQHDATAIDRWFGPGLREEVAGHYRQLLAGFPDLEVRVEGDLIAEGELVAARLALLQRSAPSPPRHRQLGGRRPADMNPAPGRWGGRRGGRAPGGWAQ